MDSLTSNLIRRLSFEMLLVVIAACLMLELASCAGTQSYVSTSPGIDGPSNRESPEEAAEVRAVIKSAKPQPFPQQLEGCWKGSVSKPDSFTRLVQVPPDSFLTFDCCAPVDYALCFDHSTDSAAFSASTLSSRFLSQWVGTSVTPVDNHSDILFSTDSDFAVLRSISHYKVRAGLMAGNVSSQIDLRATYLGPDRIYVEAAVEDSCSDSQILNCTGQPWADSTWHAEFTRRPPVETTNGARE
jgi:hypothetical protein